jgi:hypothetical protein
MANEINSSHSPNTTLIPASSPSTFGSTDATTQIAELHLSKQQSNPFFSAASSFSFQAGKGWQGISATLSNVFRSSVGASNFWFRPG